MKAAPQPNPDDPVAILTTEKMARLIEKRVLAPNGELAGPVLLGGEDDVPTYIVGLRAWTEAAHRSRVADRAGERERAPE
jgi:hypothetical protein